MGDDHPAVAASLNNLALLYQSQGRYSETEALHRKALALRQRLLGKAHPAVAQSLWHLGVIQYNQGHLAEAESLLLEALPIFEEKLGQDHPDTQNLQNWLDRVQRACEQVDAKNMADSLTVSQD